MGFKFSDLLNKQAQLNEDLHAVKGMVLIPDVDALSSDLYKIYHNHKASLCSFKTLSEDFNGHFQYRERLIRVRPQLESLLKSVILLKKNLEKKETNKEQLIKEQQLLTEILRLYLLETGEILISTFSGLRPLSAEIKAFMVPSILKMQQVIDDGLTQILPTKKKLFGLNLNNFRQEYENSYSKKHGMGLIGFFKLPLKRFFRQSSRAEELQFIEDIDSYLRHDGKTLSFPQKEVLRLSALNLLRFKIETETYGINSQLHKLIEKRLERANCKNNQNIMDDFVNYCLDLNIHVPSALALCYRNNLRELSEEEEIYYQY